MEETQRSRKLRREQERAQMNRINQNEEEQSNKNWFSVAETRVSIFVPGLNNVSRTYVTRFSACTNLIKKRHCYEDIDTQIIFYQTKKPVYASCALLIYFYVSDKRKVDAFVYRS